MFIQIGGVILNVDHILCIQPDAFSKDPDTDEERSGIAIVWSASSTLDDDEGSTAYPGSTFVPYPKADRVLRFFQNGRAGTFRDLDLDDDASRTINQ